VALRFKRLGIVRVRPLAGGFEAWRAAGHPVEPVAVGAVEGGVASRIGRARRRKAPLFPAAVPIVQMPGEKNRTSRMGKWRRLSVHRGSSLTDAAAAISASATSTPWEREYACT